MTGYVVRRILMVVPVLVGVTLITFFAMRVIPGNVAAVQLGEYATPEAIEAFEEEHGLDDPLVEQYFRWVGGMLRLDFGDSLRGTGSVLDRIAGRFPITLELAGFALFFSLIIAVPAGTISAVKQDTVLDYVVRIISMAGLAIPSFVIASMMIVLPAQWFGWIPPLQYIPFREDPLGNIGYFMLPAIALGAALAGTVMRMVRSQLLESLRQDYVRTAQAKGLRGDIVVRRHALRNALIPVVTLVGLQLGVLIGGTIIVEQIFNIPGMGRLMIESVNLRDYPVVQGIVVIMAVAYVFINLAIDIGYGWLDPRIRYD